MNSPVANLILARIEAANLGWIDKVAGLTRAITFSKGKNIGTWPIACTVNDPLACDETTIAELLPNENYNSILFFEGETFPTRVKDRVMGASFTSKLRIVVWMNCSRLGGDCDCGSLAAQNLITAIESSRRGYASGPLIEIKHTVIGGGPARGREIFSRYTFNEARSQYLHYPFDFFALDVETTFRVAKGCEDQLDPDNVNCWTGPTLIRRRYAKDFTCEELQDPDTGLTAEQLGPDCLDCAGAGADCPITFEIYLHGVLVDTIADVDPCATDNQIDITLT